MNATSVDLFGKDHWSMLAYVETCCVDGDNGHGRLHLSRVRCNPRRHPLMASAAVGDVRWKLSYSTRLRGFFEFDGRSDPEKAIAAGLMLADHDDWDCLEDLQSAGYVEIVSMANGAVRMTGPGLVVAAQLRAHKCSGQQYATFSLADDGDAEHAHPSVREAAA
jgi:hypothetical protein